MVRSGRGIRIKLLFTFSVGEMPDIRAQPEDLLMGKKDVLVGDGDGESVM